jgi:endonuclease/exonuclease/phosphatase family metal-dependent hydrolase
MHSDCWGALLLAAAGFLFACGGRPSPGEPPDTTITSGPASETREISAVFSFTGSASTARFECRLDGSDWTACTSPASYENIPVGAHTFAVRALDAYGNADPTPATSAWTRVGQTRLRVVAGNLTSGNNQSYDPGPGIRIFQGLHPDVALVQEMNYGDSSETAIRSFVDTAFGPSFVYYREATGAQIPNGIVSRYPILASGYWDDPSTGTREFAWARLDVPGPKDLWAVSVHLLTSSASTRDTEAHALLAFLQANVPASDYLVLGGDFNTDVSTEACLETLGVLVSSPNPPVDQARISGTNAGRTKPYDWLLTNADLEAAKTAVQIGANAFPAGLVFDSRVYDPLADVSPVIAGDSGAPSMQHMAVVKDFFLDGP